jgi:hypothetical protein
MIGDGSIIDRRRKRGIPIQYLWQIDLTGDALIADCDVKLDVEFSRLRGSANKDQNNRG